MEKVELTEKDFNDLGVVFGYQEYGGTCTMFGTFTNDGPNMALSKRNKIGVSWDEYYFGEGPNVCIYDRYIEGKKIGKIERFIKNKEELIKLLSELNLKENGELKKVL